PAVRQRRAESSSGTAGPRAEPRAPKPEADAAARRRRVLPGSRERSLAPSRAGTARRYQPPPRRRSARSAMRADRVVDGPVARDPALQGLVGGGTLPGVDLRDVAGIGGELDRQPVRIGCVDRLAIAVIPLAHGNVLRLEAPFDLVLGR